MKKDRHVSTYLDEEEKELIEAIEAESYAHSPSLLTPEVLREMQETARTTLGEANQDLDPHCPVGPRAAQGPRSA